MHDTDTACAASSAVEDGQTDLRRLGDRERSVEAERLRQAAALEQLHDDPRAVILLDDVVHRDDCRADDTGRGASLTKRPLAQLGFSSGLTWRGGCSLLDGDRAAEQFVVGSPDGAHAAGSKRLAEEVSIPNASHGCDRGRGS